MRPKEAVNGFTDCATATAKGVTSRPKKEVVTSVKCARNESDDFKI